MDQIRNKVIGVRKAGIAAIAIGALSFNSDTMKIENAVIIGIVAIVAIIAHCITGYRKNAVQQTKEAENPGS